jgi:hypothetical protein
MFDANDYKRYNNETVLQVQEFIFQVAPSDETVFGARPEAASTNGSAA